MTGLGVARLCFSWTGVSAPSASMRHDHSACRRRGGTPRRRRRSCRRPRRRRRRPAAARPWPPRRRPHEARALAADAAARLRGDEDPVPATIGDETPGPASGTFQATFVALQSPARRSGDTPLAAGPRQCGQSSAWTKVRPPSVTAARVRMRWRERMPEIVAALGWDGHSGPVGSHFAGQWLVTNAALALELTQSRRDDATTRRRNTTRSLRRILPAGGAPRFARWQE